MSKGMILWVLGVAFIISGCGKQANQVGSVSQGTQQTMSGLAQKAQVLLAQAKEYLGQGKYEEAMSVAKKILIFDPSNDDAKKIIEIAQAKLAIRNR